MYFKSKVAFKKPNGLKYRQPLKLFFFFWWSQNLLQIIFSLLADSLILPGAAPEYRILISAVPEEKKSKAGGRLFTAHTQWLSSLTLLGHVTLWKASSLDYSKPDGHDVALGDSVVWSLHWGAYEAVCNIAHRAHSVTKVCPTPVSSPSATSKAFVF